MVETPIEPPAVEPEWRRPDPAQRVRRLAFETQDFIEDQPETAVVIAALVGLVIGLMLGR